MISPKNKYITYKPIIIINVNNCCSNLKWFQFKTTKINSVTYKCTDESLDEDSDTSEELDTEEEVDSEDD